MKGWTNLGVVDTIYEEEDNGYSSSSSSSSSSLSLQRIDLSSPSPPLKSRLQEIWSLARDSAPDVLVHVKGTSFHLHKKFRLVCEMEAAAAGRSVRRCCVSPVVGGSRSLRSPERRFLRLSSSGIGSSDRGAGRVLRLGRQSHERLSFLRPIMAADEATSSPPSDCVGEPLHQMPINGRKSTNIVWHDCPVTKSDRQDLLHQKGCVIWITGLSGSGKSTLACALSRTLYSRGKLTYILDGDNVRHGLNSDLSFEADDRVENIRRVGEVAKLFAEAGVICIACLISPYRRDRDACRSLLPKGDFIEVFMDVPLHVCEARDPKGLYKRARAGKIKDFEFQVSRG
ncbi:PREDICTED: adenylyl-sulfate kinase 4, chloroplastic isoform X2 [Tarenaya hassleriana]|uniref:adenylyl-sulfate kinase 4, chloroplastic isoform X2 n=1 Tax=Tarenaya hassleriana TaxID=28532 RepID=UPI00053C0BE1|nr:PREDICTED: adenylyl-sulfate kinase 4, chloroplastic isoform X2 [Tarenaya hassleriana]